MSIFSRFLSKRLPFSANLRWKFLFVLPFATLTELLLHLCWQKWLLLFGECVSLPKKVFSRFRKSGALWSFAVEANADHGSTDIRLLAIPYLESILTLRLTADRAKLSQIDKSKGWLGNPSAHTISLASQYESDPLESSWLPDKETAYKWKEYNTTPNWWNQVRYKVCSSKILSFNTLGENISQSTQLVREKLN